MQRRQQCPESSLPSTSATSNESVEFYSKLFGTEPAKREPGYANFAISDPPLKLVLMEVHDRRGEGVVGALNHLGVEVESSDEVVQATDMLTAEGLDTEVQIGTTCCFAVQDKVWVNDPDGAPWEVYTVLADAPSESGRAWRWNLLHAQHRRGCVHCTG